MFIAVVSASASLAQTAAATQPAAGLKVAVVDTGYFAEDTSGIKSYVDAIKRINTEFAPRVTELQTMGTRFTNLQKEIQTLSQASQVDVQSVERKRQELETLGTDAKRREEDLQQAIQRRRNEVLAPIMNEIGNALRQYAKDKGFDMLVDVSQDERGMFLYVDQKVDVTQDFIKFYNARPATAAPARPAATRQ